MGKGPHLSRRDVHSNRNGTIGPIDALQTFNRGWPGIIVNQAKVAARGCLAALVLRPGIVNGPAWHLAESRGWRRGGAGRDDYHMTLIACTS